MAVPAGITQTRTLVAESSLCSYRRHMAGFRLGPQAVEARKAGA